MEHTVGSGVIRFSNTVTKRDLLVCSTGYEWQTWEEVKNQYLTYLIIAHSFKDFLP